MLIDFEEYQSGIKNDFKKNYLSKRIFYLSNQLTVCHSDILGFLRLSGSTNQEMNEAVPGRNINLQVKMVNYRFSGGRFICSIVHLEIKKKINKNVSQCMFVIQTLEDTLKFIFMFVIKSTEISENVLLLLN